MSTTDSKFEQHRDTEGPARRTYASLEQARGFRHEAIVSPRVSPSAPACVSICPLGPDTRSYWKHVGSGSPRAKDALYEEVKP